MQVKNISIKLIAVLAELILILSAVLVMSINCSAEEPPYNFDPTVQIMYGASSKTRYLSNIKKNLSYYETDGENIAVLSKNREFKYCFVLKENETLVIPAGKTLTLTGGAKLYGTIYIENGGTLKLDYYTVLNYGSIICDGKFSITGGTFLGCDSSLLYIGKDGEITAIDRGVTTNDKYGTNPLNGRITFDVASTVVCLGESNIPHPLFDSTPVAAICTEFRMGGCDYNISVMKNAAEINDLLYNDYYRETADLHDFASRFTVIFKGGSIDLIGRIDTKEWVFINDVKIASIAQALDKYKGI